MDANYNVADETIMFYTKIFFQNFQMPSADQLTNMTTSAISFSECFDDLNEEKEVLKQILEHPINYILINYSGAFSPKVLGRLDTSFSLASLEWICYRDTKFLTPLKKEYYSDSTRPSSKVTTLKDVVTLRGFLKVEIACLFSRMAKTKGIALRPSLLDVVNSQPLKQVGEE